MIKELIDRYYAICFACKKRRLFVRKQQIPLSISVTATSREKFCRECREELKKELTKYNKV